MRTCPLVPCDAQEASETSGVVGTTPVDLASTGAEADQDDTMDGAAARVHVAAGDRGEAAVGQ